MGEQIAHELSLRMKRKCCFLDIRLLREWVQQPANSDCDEQEGQKRPQGILPALGGATLGKKRKSHGYNQRKKQKGSKMGEVAKQGAHFGSPHRPIS